MQQLIQTLVEAFGPSGFEQNVRELIRAEIAPFVDQVSVDALGNLIAVQRGSGGGRKVLIAAHMDEIGFMVTHITEQGFLRFTSLGGLMPLHLTTARVRFADGRIGVVYAENGTDPNRVPPLDKHYIDVGAADRAGCPVPVGAPGIFWQPFVAQGDRLTAKSMDDRIGCAVAIAALQQTRNTPHDIYWVFTVQEEVGVRGATTAGNQIAPDVALSLDVTPTGDTPKGRELAIELGKGPSIIVKDSGMIAHPGLVRLLYRRAEELGIPYQPQVLVGGATDAYAIQRAGAGSAAGGISIPCRYVHSTSETVSLRDVEQSVALLVGFLQQPIVFN